MRCLYLFVSGLLLAGLGEAQAAVILVGASQAHTTIGSAIAAANANDTIRY